MLLTFYNKMSNSHVRRLISVILILSSLVTVAGATDPKKWFTIFEGEQYVDDFKLKHNQSKEIVIKSKRPKYVWFRTNVTSKHLVKYMLRWPIEMTDIGSDVSIESFGGGLKVDPINGVIKVLISNNSKEDFEILVGTKD